MKKVILTWNFPTNQCCADLLSIEEPEAISKHTDYIRFVSPGSPHKNSGIVFSSHIQELIAKTLLDIEINTYKIVDTVIFEYHAIRIMNRSTLWTAQLVQLVEEKLKETVTSLDIAFKPILEGEVPTVR